jgi:hypothetical protein
VEVSYQIPYGLSSPHHPGGDHPSHRKTEGAESLRETSCGAGFPGPDRADEEEGLFPFFDKALRTGDEVFPGPNLLSLLQALSGLREAAVMEREELG